MRWFIASIVMLFPVTIIAQIAIPLTKSADVLALWVAALLACATIQVAMFAIGVVWWVRNSHA